MFDFKELKGEFKRISWPTGKEVLKKTAITLFVCALMSAIISVYDLFFNWIMRGLESIFL